MDPLHNHKPSWATVLSSAQTFHQMDSLDWLVTYRKTKLYCSRCVVDALVSLRFSSEEKAATALRVLEFSVLSLWPEPTRSMKLQSCGRINVQVPKLVLACADSNENGYTHYHCPGTGESQYLQCMLRSRL